MPRLIAFCTKDLLFGECFSVSFWNNVEQMGGTAGGVRKFPCDEMGPSFGRVGNEEGFLGI